MEHGLATAVLCIVGGGIAAQVLAARLRIPAIVLLLALGFLVGPVFGCCTRPATSGRTCDP